jgi:hypothetical protein
MDASALDARAQTCLLVLHQGRAKKEPLDVPVLDAAPARADVGFAFARVHSRTCAE